MKFRKFLDIGRTPQQGYFKDGIELMYPDKDSIMKLAILPAYDPMDPKPTSWIPAVTGDEESDFYSVVRAAKFVGHGNRRAKTSFLSPRTFDLNADDPYEAFYDYCSRSDRWSYLTKDGRGKRLTGEVEGAIFPRMKNFFVANVMDVARPREGVFVTELSEQVAKNILYSARKSGSRIDGLAFVRDPTGNLVYGDITNPESALVVEIAWGGKSYVARAAVNGKGVVMRTKIPETLLQHRVHMNEPGSFLVKPESGQQIVDRLAELLRGYKSESGVNEIKALKEAMKCKYGDKYTVPDEDSVNEIIDGPDGEIIEAYPFPDDAETVVESEPEAKADAVEAAVERGVENEKYTPVNPPVKPIKTRKPKAKPVVADDSKVVPLTVEDAPGEDIDPSDIAAVRAMLSGK